MASPDDIREKMRVDVPIDEEAREVITDIKLICKYLYKFPEGGKAFLDWGLDDLTRASAQLSILRVTLGEYSSKYVALANYGTFYRKLSLAKDRYIARREIEAKLGKVSNKEEIESHILAGIENEWMKEVRYQELADECKTYLDSTDKVLVAINHRIRVLSNQQGSPIGDSSTTVTPPKVVAPRPVPPVIVQHSNEEPTTVPKLQIPDWNT